MRQTSITESPRWSCILRTLACLAATAGVLVTSSQVCAQAGRYNSLLRFLQPGFFKPFVPVRGGVPPAHPGHGAHLVHVPVHHDREIGNPYFWWGVLAVIGVIVLAVVGWKIGTAIGRGKTRAPGGTPGAARSDLWLPMPPL